MTVVQTVPLLQAGDAVTMGAEAESDCASAGEAATTARERRVSFIFDVWLLGRPARSLVMLEGLVGGMQVRSC